MSKLVKHFLVPHLAIIYQTATKPALQAFRSVWAERISGHWRLSLTREAAIFMAADREVRSIVRACNHGFDPTREIREHSYGKRWLNWGQKGEQKSTGSSGKGSPTVGGGNSMGAADVMTRRDRPARVAAEHWAEQRGERQGQRERWGRLWGLCEKLLPFTLRGMGRFWRLLIRRTAWSYLHVGNILLWRRGRESVLLTGRWRRRKSLGGPGEGQAGPWQIQRWLWWSEAGAFAGGLHLGREGECIGMALWFLVPTDRIIEHLTKIRNLGRETSFFPIFFSFLF